MAERPDRGRARPEELLTVVSEIVTAGCHSIGGSRSGPRGESTSRAAAAFAQDYIVRTAEKETTMTGDTSAANKVPPEEEPFQRQSVAMGISLIAASMLLILAVTSILEGISALVDDELYVAGVDYVYKFDTTTWGWIHLVLGVLALICALGVIFGTAWGRYSALGIAALVILANFLSLPHYPWWSIVVIALSVAVIWALTTWQPEH
ncbi:DUF7144 family membrane protein [Nocardia amikacinitolerans]